MGAGGPAERLGMRQEYSSGTENWEPSSPAGSTESPGQIISSRNTSFVVKLHCQWSDSRLADFWQAGARGLQHTTGVSGESEWILDIL